ncbi:uncharacterized protein LOC120340775 [Styela clava]|uniref:uncharacterized protein LOC120340775 n=1 Tax=Styela clava TaxID=7725 RepID=UPI00193A4DAC|nr:uncharacterized protein LOC120340775 [Styela clava]
MRAVAASRKLGKRNDNSSSDKSGSNGGTALSGARQRSNNRNYQKKSVYNSTVLYAPVSTTSPDVPTCTFDPNEIENQNTSMITDKNMAPPGSNTNKVSPTTDKSVTTPASTRSYDFEKHVGSPSSTSVCNGPKKNIKDTMTRTVSNLSRAPSSVATTNIGAASKIESKAGVRNAAPEKRYYAKAIGLMSVGGFIFAVGIALAALHFAGYEILMMAGPVSLSIGLLLLVCGIVWIPIIQTKLKRQQQIMSRTFSL